MELDQNAISFAEGSQDRNDLQEIVRGKDLHEGLAHVQEIVVFLFQGFYCGWIVNEHVQPVFSGFAGGVGNDGRVPPGNEQGAPEHVVPQFGIIKGFDGTGGVQRRPFGHRFQHLL